MRFRGRSFMAFVLAPSAPLSAWLAEVDKWSRNSPDFFVGRAIILDLAGIALSQSGISELLDSLAERGIRVMGLEGAHPDQLGPSLPPLLKGGRPTAGFEASAPASSENTRAAATAGPSQRQEPTSLMIESPIRSGQSIIFPYGDVTVLGSVASGAEIIAGGSIHIYGTLRGQAMAGAAGSRRARIFCHRFDAELLAIGAYYKTADEIEDSLRRGPIQAWLDGNSLQISAMN